MTGSQNHGVLYIFGAGFSGMAIARDIAEKGVLGRVAAFLDDDPAKIGTSIDDIPVLGPIAEVVGILRPGPLDEAIIAMPTVPKERLREIWQLLKATQFSKVRILPAVSQIIEGDAHLIQTRELDPQDLLSRPPVTIGLKQSLHYLRGKRVLITGAGGSIGSELARQLLLGGAERLYILGHGENSVYQIDKELRMLQAEGIGEKAAIVPIVGELQDEDFLKFIMPRLHPDVIFHTAAYKHVPMMEHNPVVCIKNNVFGTWFLLKAAQEAGVQRFVLISTDKVVNPASVYGVSKKIAEAMVLSWPVDQGQDFMAVRFGNVLGSRGSIVPLFRDQIQTGGPVTITDPQMCRYFMTIPEASSLVLKAGGVGNTGQLYLLDMGEPLFIKDLAEQMIKFYGYTPERDIKIEYIGLREGEKLFETLHESYEECSNTPYPRILGVGKALDWLNHGAQTSHGEARKKLEVLMEQLRPICFLDSKNPGSFRNRKLLRETLHDLIPSLPLKPDEKEY